MVILGILYRFYGYLRDSIWFYYSLVILGILYDSMVILGILYDSMVILSGFYWEVWAKMGKIC